MDSNKIFNALGNIEDIVAHDVYREIWNDVSCDVQNRKADRANLSPESRLQIFEGLVKRPSYLIRLADIVNAKNIVEIGTAEGLQFYSFAQYLKEKGMQGKVWSCDILDKRIESYKDRYDNTEFYLGNSKGLSNHIPQDISIDLIYIDAGHNRWDVINDVNNMKKLQHNNTIWVFDDYDERFGCYQDINDLCKLNSNFKSYKVGNTASNSPNHQMIIHGRL
tara:strand:+ start:357 stop:1019 length:663 start_codon:yes stop_codon:yes gene_type:complete